MNIKISLIDNNYVVQAKTDLTQTGQEDPLSKFIEQVKEEMVTGQTAFLQIEDSKKDPITFEISQAAGLF